VASASILLATTTLFVVGVVIERSGRVQEGGSRIERHGEAKPHAEGEEEASGAAPSGGEAAEDNELLLGVDLESPFLVALAVVLSIGMALAVLLTDKRGVMIAVTVAMLGFTLLGLREILHQTRESHAGLAALAVASHWAISGAAHSP